MKNTNCSKLGKRVCSESIEIETVFTKTEINETNFFQNGPLGIQLTYFDLV